MTTRLTNNDPWQDDLILLMDSLEVSAKQLPSVGTTAKTCIYKENKLQLLKYQSLNIKQKSTPILLIYALVNRPYITDLEPNRSLVLRLLEKGYPVYLIDWGYPDASDCFTSLNDYINGYIQRCVKRVCRDSNKKKIDLLGICQGGVFSLCYSAIHPKYIRKLVTLVTPVDFHSEGNILSLWTRNIDMRLVCNGNKNIPAKLINQLFKSIKPYQLNRDKYRHLNQLINQPAQLDTFIRMEQWLNDGPDLCSSAAIEFVQKFYQGNQLHTGHLSIGNYDINLKKIKCPILNLYANNDHIVSPSSSAALKKHIQPKYYQEKILNGGHIGAFISQHTQQSLLEELSQFLD